MIEYYVTSQGMTMCRNPCGLVFYLLGQAPKDAARSVIATGGLNRR